MSVAVEISPGTAVDTLALAMKAGLGAVKPFAATHAAQSCDSVRVTVAAATVTAKPLLSGRIVTPVGRRFATVMRVDCAGTTHRRSRMGDLGTSVGRSQAARRASGIAPATIENSAAYIAHWSKQLRNEPKWLVQAASAAAKAADLIIGKQSKEQDDSSEERSAEAA